MQLWKPQQLLQTKTTTKTKLVILLSMCDFLETKALCLWCVSHLRAVVAAMLDDPLHLFVHQFDTAQAGLLKTLHLPLHQQLEGNFWHKQSRPRSLWGRKTNKKNRGVSQFLTAFKLETFWSESV